MTKTTRRVLFAIIGIAWIVIGMLWNVVEHFPIMGVICGIIGAVCIIQAVKLEGK